MKNLIQHNHLVELNKIRFATTQLYYRISRFE